MSLDVYLKQMPTEPLEVWSSNVTHNLGKMAGAAGLYTIIWRPDELGVKRAGELIGPLSWGLRLLLHDPDYYRQYNSDNGWGDYEGFVRFVAEYIIACREHPDAEIEVSR
jgi:hypothetical protein